MVRGGRRHGQTSCHRVTQMTFGVAAKNDDLQEERKENKTEHLKYTLGNINYRMRRHRLTLGNAHESKPTVADRFSLDVECEITAASTS